MHTTRTQRVRRTSARALTVAGIAVAALALSACAGGGGAAGAKTGLGVDLNSLATETAAAKGPVDAITWNLPYEPLSLDPMKTFNYAENTVDANLCDSLQRLNPDLTTGPGLAEKVDTPNDTTVVYTLRDGVKFWDGSPLTPADVVFSIDRQSGAHNADSYYSEYFTSVKSVEQTGANQVTVHLSKPDALFAQGMATAAGAIVSKAYATQAGEKFGTPQGGIMCTGAFKLDRWNAGKSIDIVKNDAYWDTKLMPKVGKVSFSFIADETTAINALRSGDVDGQFFYLPPTGMQQLTASKTVQTTYGKSFVFFTLAGASDSGPFADPKVRQALLDSIDRQAISDVVFQKAAIPAPTLAGPDYWGDQKSLFEPAFTKFGTKPDPGAAKQLLAGVDTSKEITIAIQGSSAVHEQTANLIQAAGQAIGLKIKTKVIPVEQYGNLYYDPKARAGLDAFFTTWYGNVTDPLDVYQVFTTGGANNFGNYTGVNDLVQQARSTLDPAERAKTTVEIQAKVTEDLPWTPLTYLPTILVQNDKITGAVPSIAYLSYPWAATIGSAQ